MAAEAVGPPTPAGSAVQPTDPAAKTTTLTLSGLAKAIPSATVVTALLFYFGWKRTDTEATWFGVDESALGLSATDYMLRSISSLFLPLGIACALVMIYVFADRVVVSWVARRQAAGRTRAVKLIIAALLLMIVVAPLATWLATRAAPPWQPALVPPSFLLGVLLFAYGNRLWSRLRADPAPGENLVAIALAALATLSLFWSVSNYATIVGRGDAQFIAAHVDDLSHVVLTSSDDLHLSGPGLDATVGTDCDGKPVHRYVGLRLLQRSGGTYFLLSRGWARGSGAVIVVPGDTKTSVTFVRGAALEEPGVADCPAD